MTTIEYKKHWGTLAKKLLIGKKVVNCDYLSEQEMEILGWYKSSLVISFDDGTHIYASADDEGNDGGALFTSNDALSTIPTI
jgi:hypothetical protein